MNKCKITKDFIKKIRVGLKGGKTNRKTRLWLQKWPVTIKGNKIMHKNKPLVPKEDIHKILKKELLTGGCPLSIESAFNYLYSRMWGISRRDLADFLKKTEKYQLMKVRPPDPNKTKASYMSDREGVTRFLMEKKHGGKNHLAADLMYIPKPWSKFKYFLCVVHIRSGYSWFEPQSSKTPQLTLTKFKPILKEVEKKYGKVGMLSTDFGGEFLSVFKKFLEKRGITHQLDHKSFWAEKKIQTFGRLFGNMITVHGFRKALALSLEKIRNIKNRVTRKAPADWTKQDNEKRLPPARMLKKGKRTPRRTIEFELQDSVRHLLKAADQINAFYKSYRSLEGTNKHANWSKQVYKIQKKRFSAGNWIYFLNQKWYKGWQLQKVDGVLTLSLDPTAPQKVPKQRAKAIQKIPVEPKYRKVQGLDIQMKGWDQPLRAKRVRKKVNYRV